MRYSKWPLWPLQINFNFYFLKMIFLDPSTLEITSWNFPKIKWSWNNFLTFSSELIFCSVQLSEQPGKRRRCLNFRNPPGVDLLTVLVKLRSLHLVDDRRNLVPLALGPVALQLRFQSDLGEGNPGCHRRSVPVVTVLPGHDGSNCRLPGEINV